MDMKIQIRSIILQNPFDSQDAVEKSCVDDMESNQNIIGNTKQVEFIDKNLDKVRFDKLNCPPAVQEQLTPKLCVSQSVNGPTLEKFNRKDNCNSHSLTNLSQLTPNSEPTDDFYATTKAYVDSLSDNERSRRDFTSVLNDQGNHFNVYNLFCFMFNGKAKIEEKVVKYKHVDETMGAITVLKIYN